MRSPGTWVVLAVLSMLLNPWTGRAEPAAPAVKSDTHTDVQEVRDVAYYDGPDADPVKHKLDLYLPNGRKNFPVLLFVHGGGWMSGDKKYWFDVYGNLGRTFARQGIGVVVTNYRLSPKVQHPAHAQDVARAFAWTYRNIARYGGRPDQIFLSGHSAGGHLVALVATDASYLKAEQLDVDRIKGVMPISGVYRIPPGALFSATFSTDNDKRRQASPLSHVSGKHPPFLILYADADFPTCDRMSEDFCGALKKCNCDACTHAIPKRDHLSIIAHITEATDPATRLMLDFIARHTGTMPMDAR